MDLMSKNEIAECIATCRTQTVVITSVIEEECIYGEFVEGSDSNQTVKHDVEKWS